MAQGSGMQAKQALFEAGEQERELQGAGRAVLFNTLGSIKWR